MDKVNNDNIKIYVSCHKESYIPKNGLYKLFEGYYWVKHIFDIKMSTHIL